jgi:hypothetical protein
MNTAREETERLGIQIARDVVREAELRKILAHKPHWLFGGWPFFLASYPGMFALLLLTELAYPVRIPIAMACSGVFGFTIEHHRVKKKLRAALELLAIRERRG